MSAFQLRLACVACALALGAVDASAGDTADQRHRMRFVVRQQEEPAQPPVRQAPPRAKESQADEPVLPVCKPLDQVGIAAWLPQGDLPPDLSERCFPPMLQPGTTARPWAEFGYGWEASNLYHLPLYFEDVALERYGHTLHPVAQPAISAAHFFGTVPMLPYKMGLEPPLEHVYALGYYRPGNPAPRLLYPLPLRLDAASLQSGAVVGLIFLIP